MLGNILPYTLLSYYAHICHLFIFVYLSTWIIQFIQDYFFTSTIEPNNKAVFITGCDSGFGHTIAKNLDKKGFKVFAGCLDPKCEGAYNLKETCSTQLQIIDLDVTDNDSVQRALDTVKENLHGSELWAVVNNAGVLRGFILEMTRIEDFEACMQVNALGPVRVTKAFFPLLRKTKGRVVNICSVCGRFPPAYLGAYNMSKYAAVAFTEVLMQEAREFGIRVISVEPDVFRTPLSSEKYLSSALGSAIEDADVGIKDAYGARFIEKMKDFFVNYFAMSSKRIHIVTKAVEKAVCLHYPADVYRPRSNLLTKFIYFVGCRVPTKFLYMSSIVLFYIAKVPKTSSGLTFFEKLLNM